MANIVFKLSDKDITTLMSRITFDTENLPQGMKARAKVSKYNCKIYQSGKVMFQGNHAEAVSKELLPQHSQLNTNKTKKKNMANSSLEQTLMYDQFNCIGDEAGKWRLNSWFFDCVCCFCYQRACSYFKKTSGCR